ncbi:hypothetical protein CU098_010254 [Rhizopus stolonifer]|uniref:Uncharacterized protein n=1 Tax=Rhizopus stolonifer TaxID=4846 RepID=A0A367KMA5_RHIST|nr:hypothetical protein CU098_010254 [Rhizopus stolonifer]
MRLAINLVHHLGKLLDVMMLEDENKPFQYLELVMEEVELRVIQLPHMVWIPIKYKPEQVVQFASLLHNKEATKFSKVASETRIEINNTYEFHKQLKYTKGTIIQVMNL